jgi:hypothetical protein
VRVPAKTVPNLAEKRLRAGKKKIPTGLRDRNCYTPVPAHINQKKETKQPEAPLKSIHFTLQSEQK